MSDPKKVVCGSCREECLEEDLEECNDCGEKICVNCLSAHDCMSEEDSDREDFDNFMDLPEG